jgi:hypothetical protein
MYLDGETDVVELQLQEGTARVQIDPNTREVKGYEIQEEESRLRFLKSKRALILLLSSIAEVVAALKLANIF